MERFFQPENIVFGEHMSTTQRGGDVPNWSAAVVCPTDIDHDRHLRSDGVANSFDMRAVGTFGFAEVLPAELECRETGFLESRRLLAGFLAVAAEQRGGICSDLGVDTTAEEFTKGQIRGFAFDV